MPAPNIPPNAPVVLVQRAGGYAAALKLVGQGGQMPFISARRPTALAKLPGCSGANVTFNQAGNVNFNFSNTIKMDQEGDFDEVQFVIANRCATSVTLKMLVGVTETSDFSTSNNIGQPVIGGTAWPQLQGATDVNGWQNVTGGNGSLSSFVMPAANTALQLTLTDRIPKSSIPRTDGVLRPFLIWRAQLMGATTPGVQLACSNNTASGTAAMRNRILQSSGYFGANDSIASPNQGHNITATLLETFPILSYRYPVFSVWGIGDSITQGDSILATNEPTSTSGTVFSTWGMRACADLSTPQKPVVWANLGCSSNTSKTYITVLRAYLAAGVPPPSCLVISPLSTNDLAINVNLREKQIAQVTEILQIAKQYGIPYVIMWPWIVNDASTQSEDNFRIASNALAVTIAAQYGVQFLQFPGLLQGISPDRFVTIYKGPGNVHPDELAFENIMAPSLKAALLPLIG